MFTKIATSIFFQILLATLLPVILIFSLIVGAISHDFFKASAVAAQKEIIFFAQKTADQIRRRYLHNLTLAELTAKDLALVAEDSDSAREAALHILRSTMRKTQNTYRIRMHILPEKGSFGIESSFSYTYYIENGALTGHRLIPGEKMNMEVVPRWYEIPLEQGTPYHDSFASARYGPDEELVYAGSTNFPIIKNGIVIGCVGLDVLHREAVQLIDDWRDGSSYRMIFSGDDGTILSASSDGMVGRSLYELNFEEAFLTRMKSAIAQDINFTEESHSPVFNRSSRIAVHPIDMPGLTSRIFLYSGTPTDIVYHEAISALRTGLLMFLGGLMLFVGSLFVVTRRITKPIEELIAAADRIAHDQFDVANHNHDEEDSIRHREGRLRYALRTMLKKIEEGHRLRLIAMEAEYEKRRLETTAAAKERFFVNMSHEIRTPMNVIYGMTEMLSMEKLTEGQKRYVQDIKESAASLLNIINDILDLSRLETGELPLLPRHYDFNALAENVCSLCQYLTGKKDLQFFYETAGDIPDVLYGDDGRLRQVLLNILGNAIKFTEQGSVTLRIVGEDERLCFGVTDTGIGIREEEIQYLFEPFKRLEGQKFRHIQGSGLGLSISNNIVKFMGGEIFVSSEYGKGSTFSITIPKTLGDATEMIGNSNMQPSTFTPDIRVLVVDDSESNLRVATEFLRKFNVSVATACSGAACLEMLNKETYDLLFLDHMMPEMDGIETAARIRALGWSFATLPLVALTANAVAGAREMFLAASMDDFLAKPIEKAKLQAILMKWLPGKSLEYEKGDDERVEQNAEKEDAISGLLVKAADVKGLDVRLGLSRVTDNQELYGDLLGLIIEIIPNALKKIDTALREGDTTTLITEAHMVKSSLANLGATELSEQMAELEREGSMGDMAAFMDTLGPLRITLEEFVDQVQKLQPEGKNRATLLAAPNGTRDLEFDLRALRAELEAFNYANTWGMIVDLMRFDWGKDWNGCIETIHTHIKYFDYEAAKDVLDESLPRQEERVSV